MNDEVFFVTDIETDGPIPFENSMLSLASVACTNDGRIVGEFEANLNVLPNAKEHPDTLKWWKDFPEAWAFSRENQEAPEVVMANFVSWVKQHGGIPVFAAHPVTFDAFWVFSYLRNFAGENIFMIPSLDIWSYAMATFGSSFREGHRSNWPKEWSSGFDHSHKAIDDARAYAHALIEMLKVNHTKRTLKS